jgi:lysophospholipase L1-like esterase
LESDLHGNGRTRARSLSAISFQLATNLLLIVPSWIAVFYATKGRMRLRIFAVAILMCTVPLLAQQRPVPDPNRWEPAIQKFEDGDKASAPAKGGIVFVGASSIVRWNLAESFPDLKGIAVNRGFGGSEMADAARYAPRVVIPYAPRVVVLYPGENDIARGVSAETVGEGFQKFYTTVHGALPNARIVAIGLKPTPVRWQFIDEMRKANKLIRGYCEGHSGCVYIDVHPDMLGSDGKPKPELYVSDGEHMTPAGYTIWNRLVRPYLTVKK